MADARKFSRARREIKLNRREEVERILHASLLQTIRDQDPTLPAGAADVVAELGAAVVSQLMAQTQSTQRALKTLRDDLVDYSSEFVEQLVAEARKDVRLRVRKTVAAPPSDGNALALPDDWAGPVAGPTLIETRFGIPRSTLYRWQKRGEAIALNTRTSRKPVFPLRQFVDGRPAEGIAEIVGVFEDPRTAWLWLISPQPALDGAKPIDELLKGNRAGVIDAASHASGNG